MPRYGKNRTGYFVASLVFAAGYAVFTGRLPVVSRLVDGATCGLLVFFVGVLLWNIFRYALPDGLHPVHRLAFLLLLSALATGCITGIETFVLYLCFPSLSGEIIAAVPVRIFILLLWFVIIRLSYVAFTARQETGPAPVSPPQTQAQSVERITVRNGQKIKIIPVAEILYLQADGDYVAIHTVEGRWLKEQTMKYAEEILPASRFVRIHRSYIVNLTHISRIERYGEQQSIVLHNGEKIRISAARYQILKQRLDI
jgi:hypothetical protein